MIVSRYHITRHYGGPEEGGWYYDRRLFMETDYVQRTPEEARAHARELNEAEKASQPGQGRFSVLGGTDVRYMAEEYPQQADNASEPAPRYE